jgi:hypothetical protein
MLANNSVLRTSGRHAAPVRGRPRVPLRTLATTTMAVAALFGSLLLAEPAQASGSIYIGSSAGGVQSLSARTGEPMASHAYSWFSKGVPTNARMISVRSNATWSQVAAASPGSTVYNDIARWADTIKSRSGRVMLAYHHEPEAGGSSRYGTASQFTAAYRKVVTIFRQRGANNVEWTWQMTAYSFRTSPGDARNAAKWYPGNAYVDNVGGDAYNWFDCGPGNGKWSELSAVVDPVFSFARSHGKKASLPEFGSDSGANRTKWLQNAHRYFVANRDVLTAAFYFHRTPPEASNRNCQWPLATNSEFDAFGDIARDRAHFSA